MSENEKQNIWVVLGAGPNHHGWDLFAAEKNAKVFCCNGSILRCPVPDAYTATDGEAISAYSHFVPDCTIKFIGVDSVKAVCPDYLIGGKRVRTAAVWGIYLALEYFKADEVHAFGVYGELNGEWNTITHAPGVYHGKKPFLAALAKGAVENNRPGETIVYEGAGDRNENAAEGIFALRRQYNVPIVIHNGGYVADLLEKMEAS